MNLSKILTLCFSIFVLFSCNRNPDKRKESKKTTEKAVYQHHGSFNHPNRININSVVVIKNVYVIDRNGIDFKEGPDVNSKTLGSFEYGEWLEVIEFNNDWLGVKKRVRRKTKNGYSEGWEKVYVKRESTSGIHEITLIEEDLNIISSITQGGSIPQYFDNEKKLSNYFKINLITHDIFLEKKKTSIDYLVRDASNRFKLNNKIEIKTDTGLLTFNKTPKSKEDNDYLGEYDSYLGDIPDLNVSVVYLPFYEGHEYLFINKTTGKRFSFIDYPYLSADQKYLISLYPTYDMTTSVQLCKVNGEKINHLITIEFNKWMSSNFADKQYTDMFWGDDGCFYARIQHVKVYAASSKKYQYIRMKIL